MEHVAQRVEHERERAEERDEWENARVEQGLRREHICQLRKHRLRIGAQGLWAKIEESGPVAVFARPALFCAAGGTARASMPRVVDSAARDNC